MDSEILDSTELCFDTEHGIAAGQDRMSKLDLQNFLNADPCQAKAVLAELDAVFV